MLYLVLGLWAGASSGLGFTTNSSWLLFLGRKKKKTESARMLWLAMIWKLTRQKGISLHKVRAQNCFSWEQEQGGGREREREQAQRVLRFDWTGGKKPTTLSLIAAGSRKAVSANSLLCPPRVSLRSGTVDLALITPLDSHFPLSVKDNSQGIGVPGMSVRKPQGSQP